MNGTNGIGHTAGMADVARVRVPSSYLGHRRIPAPTFDRREADT